MSNLNGKSADHSDRPQHTEIESLLAAYVAGELDEETEQVVVERHLINCATCQQSIMEISRIFMLLSTLAHPDTLPSNNTVVTQPSFLADAVLAQFVQGKPVDDNETIEVVTRPFSSFPGVLSVRRDSDASDDHAEAQSLLPWIRKYESQRQQESRRNMNTIFVPKSRHDKSGLHSGRDKSGLHSGRDKSGLHSGRDKSGPYGGFATVVATVLILFVIGGSLMVLIRMAQHTPNGLSGSSSVVSMTPTPPKSAKQLAHDLVKQFHQEAATWGAAHLYHDSFDGHDYPLDSAYMQAGMGGILDHELAQARTDADFRGVVDEVNNALFNLHMLEVDARDATPFNQPHQSDLQVLNHYHLQGQVIIVSLAGQAMRVYQNGKLVKAFLITSGQPKLPSLPIVTKEMLRASQVTFKASVPRSNPDWFPDTHVNYAIEYHTGGYYLHDAWWQVDFGPATQFPHHDASGNLVRGSNGGIGLDENDTAWVYNNTSLHTTIAIY